MKAVVLDAPEQFACVERAAPRPAADEAAVRMVALGICASDLATIRGDNPIAIYPLTLGHESIGVVESAPDDAPARPGDWVTIFPSIGCGRCPACKARRTNHCPVFKVMGISHPGGLFAERVAVPAQQLIKLPRALQHEEGVLVEPVAVAAHVVRRSGLAGGERVCVIGAGVIGILVAQVARAYGAGPIVLVDRLEERRAMLRGFGFERFVLARNDEPVVQKALASGGAFDLVLDTVSITSTLQQGVEILKPGGRLVMIGVPHGQVPLALPYPTVYRRELSLIASRNYAPDDFRESIRLMSTGAIDATQMVTARLPLADFAQAYDELVTHPERHLKIMLRP